MILILIMAGLVWRLEQGPIALPMLARQAERIANAALSDQQIEIGAAAIAWAGWRQGHNSPFAVNFTEIRLTDAQGGTLAELPAVSASLAPAALLRGRLALRAIELTGLRLAARRDAEGGFAFGFAGTAEAEGHGAPPTADQALTEILTAWLAPPTDDTALSALRRIELVDARLAVADARSGRFWSASLAQLVLDRHSTGGLDFAGRATVQVADENIPIDIAASLAGELWRGEASLSARRLHPKILAGISPEFAALGALEAEVDISLIARFAGASTPDLLMARLRTGAGQLHIPDDGGHLPFAALSLDATLAEDVVRIERLAFSAVPSPRAGAPVPPVITAQGEARLQEGRWRASAGLSLRALDIADLTHYWPPSVAPKPREWLAENLTAGMLEEGQWRIEASIGLDGNAPEITTLEGEARARGVTAHWLRPILPIEAVDGRAKFSLNLIEIDITSGMQAGTQVKIDSGNLKISFATDPEITTLEAKLSGPLAEAWAVLRHPRLKIFENRPPPINDPTGHLQQATLRLVFPLIKTLDIEDIDIQAELAVQDLRIPRLAFNRDLERGVAMVSVRNTGLTVNGTAVLGDIEARIQQETDFRNGAPGDIVSREIISARADARQLAALGLDGRPLLDGPVQLDVRQETRRNGQSRLALRADLRAATLEVEPLAWRKPPGTPGQGEAVVLMQGGAITLIESFRVETPDALVRGRASEIRQNTPQRIELTSAALGRSRFSGELRPPPPRGGGQWVISLRGPVLDLAPVLAKQDGPAGPEEVGNPASVQARFDRVLLPHEQEFSALEARLQVNALGVMQQADMRARLSGTGGFVITINPDGARRAVSLTSDDGGAMLRAFDVLRTIQGGKLTVTGHYEHSRPGAALVGSAVLEDFSVRDAPGLGKLLQAMTLYGLIDALRGPGLNFARLTAPFSLSPETLILNDARAFSASLGLTTKGRIDRRQDTVDLEGTIVPAYIFNTLLGRIPIFGRLFSPEEGGGVFAVAFRMRGPVKDPQVTVNPLAALTPGFLRGIFGLGQEPAGQAPEAPR